MKKLVLKFSVVILAMAIATPCFAMSRVFGAKNKQGKAAASCYTKYGNPAGGYENGWNFQFMADGMKPFNIGPDGRHNSINFAKDENGELISNPRYSAKYPSYEPVGYNACFDNYMATH